MLLNRRSATALTAALVLGTTAAVAPTISSAAPTSGRTAGQHSTQAAAGTAAGDYTSRVHGTWRNGRVHGTFVPVRSFSRGGRTWVQGDLLAKVRRSNGTLVGKVMRHNLALPVRGPGAHTNAMTAQAQTCRILHLVLGPLNLNLLGLKVHLNRVVLNITAASGPGNLLGNLLCAVTHLLDNTNPTQLSLLRLSSLLNRVIGRIA